MRTFTVQVTNNSAMKVLQDLEDKHYIKIVKDADINSPALPGKALSLNAFKEWITDAEKEPTVSLKDAKAKWESKKKQLEKLTM